MIEAAIVDLVPIGSAHGGTTNCLTMLVARLEAEERVQMCVQGPVRLDAHKEPRPDLKLLCRVRTSIVAATQSPPTCFLWSKWPTLPSPSTAASSSRFTLGMGSRRFGLLIWLQGRWRLTRDQDQRAMLSGDRPAKAFHPTLVPVLDIATRLA